MITIIVLLILAGVSIAVLTGDNGILTNSKKVNQQTAYSGAEEQAKLAYMAVKTEILAQVAQNGIYNAQDDIKNLTKIVASDLTGEEWTIEPSKDDTATSGETITATYTNSNLVAGEVDNGKPTQNGKIVFKISLKKQDATLKADGRLVGGNEIVVKAKDIDGTEIEIVDNKDSLSRVYGKKVKNYSAGEETYRLFYIDFEGKFGEPGTIFLKADPTGEMHLSNTVGTYNPDENAINNMKLLNPIWGQNDGQLNRAVEYCATWLCEQTTPTSTLRRWENYLDLTNADNINFVVGSPSLELYVKSYNQVPHERNHTLGIVFNEHNLDGYEYLLDGKESLLNTGAQVLDYVDYGGMYCNLSKTWFLASPHMFYGDPAMCVVETSQALTRWYQNTTAYICPIISLKPSFKPELSD